MKHKHQWQYIKSARAPDNPVLDSNPIRWAPGKIEAQFICHCGKIKWVEIKNDRCV